nr:PREDICTED: keratin, type II cytoskeletal 8-like [Lepisosteus oculatus]
MAYSSRPYSARSFSSQSYTPTSRANAPRANSQFSLRGGYPTINRSNSAHLLNSPSSEIDPQVHQIKNKEKDDIKGLNDKFAGFIEKVRDLEKQNKILETRLHILQEKDNYKSNADQIAAEYRTSLRNQINGLAQDRKKLERELVRIQGQVEDHKNKYEDEINRRTELENDFVITKKDVDDAYLQKVELELNLETLTDELDYMKKMHDEDIRELRSQINNTSVVLEMDNNRGLDMNHIVQEVRAQYEEIAARSREEAEQWNKKKFNDMTSEAGKYEKELRDLKKDIADLIRLIQRLNSEADAMKRQDMARQIREYQDLMNLKLAMDIEIATYKKLLEGEEMR